MDRSRLIKLIITFTLLSVSSCGAADWWEDSSLYQIYPRSWKDSNGDGIGDLNGITEKLEYLKEIGITATWLSPIFKSPMSDFGYDISNFYEVDPIFGTLDDFDALIKKAKKIGIKIILDFVPNHSSDECEWFQKSIERKDGYENFYVWENGFDDPKNPGKKLPPSNWVSIFGGKMWTWNEKRQQFYLHQFQAKQPDLNYKNPKVREEMLKVLKFWLDRGVDGFRIDAVPHIFEKVNDDGTYPDEPLSGATSDPDSYDYLTHIYTKDQYETVEVIYEWRAFLNQYQKEHGGETRILLAEAYSPIDVIDQYFGNGTHFGAHIPFNFNLMGLRGSSNARDLERSINSWMEVMWAKHKTANWVLGNHDNSRIATNFGNHKVDLVNVIITALPGATVTYYGEEIGMSNVKTECTEISCDDRDPERTPFQWSDGKSAGFSSSSKTWLPIADDYKKVNVKVERGADRSTLNVFKGLQKLKRSSAYKAFKEDGGWSYSAINDEVFQVIRSSSKEEYRILVNFGEKLEEVGPLINSVNSDEHVMEYFLLTSNSPHRIGEKVNLNNIYLMPFEAVVLRRKIRN
ncbi:maltase A2 [Episyrphus balteatus]|uniref:maltase A2 n=1 Tax=Episyrphus balteatus TaxID=286459 RepID=UPI0024858646|nr:maltase A2 [Episyrphus balteatus]